jgi:hypothetical protein
MSQPEDFEIIGVTNRQPKNPNELLDNKFTFVVSKLPETSFKCRSANIPGTSLPVVWQNTTQNPIPHSGLNITYDPLEVEFIVDEDLNNYCEIVNWMRMLAAPVNNLGYGELKLQGLGPDPNRGLVSDAILTVLTNEFTPNIFVFFRDAFPVRLSELRFSNNTENPGEQVATVEFAYAWFDLRDKNEPDVYPTT